MRRRNLKEVDFKDVVFEKMIICGVEGLFTSLRVDKDTIPSGWNKYSVRHSEVVLHFRKVCMG